MAQMDHSIRLLSHGVARDRQSASFLSFPERPHGEQPQRDKHAQLEAELAEVRRRWGESRDAFAARAVSDRDEIERLTSAVNDQEKALLLQLQEGLQAAAARAQAAQTQQQLQILQAENQQLKASLGTKQTVPGQQPQPGTQSKAGTAVPKKQVMPQESSAIQAAVRTAQEQASTAAQKLQLLQGQLEAAQRAQHDHQDASQAARMRYNELIIALRDNPQDLAQVLTAHAAANWIHLPNGALEPLGPVPPPRTFPHPQAHPQQVPAQPAAPQAATSRTDPPPHLPPQASSAGLSHTQLHEPPAAPHRPASTQARHPPHLDLTTRPPFDNIKVVKPRPESPRAAPTPQAGHTPRAGLTARAGAVTGRTAGQERSVLGEVQPQCEDPQSSTRRTGEDFEGWQARKQLQRRVEGLQARLKALKGSSELAESRAEHLARQLTDASKALEQSAHERAALESKLSASLASKPTIVPMIEVQALHEKLSETQDMKAKLELQLQQVYGGRAAQASQTSLGQEDLDAGLSMTERLQRRDELLAHQQSSLEASDQKCRCLQQRIEDLFGAEAAELEPPKMQYTAKQGQPGVGAIAARSQREARLLNTIKALQLALQRAAHQAAGNAPSNLKYMQTREQCKTLQARAEAAEKQTQALEDVRSKALVLARQNGTLQAGNSSLRRQLKAARGEAGAARELTEQVSDLQQSLTVAHAEADGLRGRLAAADSLPADIDHLADEELRPVLRQLQDENGSLRQELAAFDPAFWEELEDLKHSHHVLQEKCAAYVAQFGPA